MAKAKFDGVVEVVRYKQDGDVDWVRAYVRHGPVFSDHQILDRAALLQQLKAGKKFMSGKRIKSMGASFDVSKALRVLSGGGREVIVTDNPPGSHDDLVGVPII